MRRVATSKMASSSLAAALMSALLLVATLGAGCHRSAQASASADASAPPLVVKEDTPGLLLTWIDEKGDFHVETKPADVPIVGRDAVRVVDPTREDSARVDAVFVADLRVAGPDGSFPVHTMSREDFDGLAVARRAKGNQPTLASAEAHDAGGAGGARERGGETAAAGRPTVIIYGASWCGACHQAMAYFKKKGVTFIEKDIEQDPGAEAEMTGKLRRAGLRGGGIPVLDIRGRIMVGFEPHAVDDALGSPI
jgi:glutaredoxin